MSIFETRIDDTLVMEDGELKPKQVERLITPLVQVLNDFEWAIDRLKDRVDYLEDKLNDRN